MSSCCSPTCTNRTCRMVLWPHMGTLLVCSRTFQIRWTQSLSATRMLNLKWNLKDEDNMGILIAHENSQDYPFLCLVSMSPWCLEQRDYCACFPFCPGTPCRILGNNNIISIYWVFVICHDHAKRYTDTFTLVLPFHSFLQSCKYHCILSLQMWEIDLR
jgi:hypothetical protein